MQPPAAMAFDPLEGGKAKESFVQDYRNMNNVAPSMQGPDIDYAKTFFPES